MSRTKIAPKATLALREASRAADALGAVAAWGTGTIRGAAIALLARQGLREVAAMEDVVRAAELECGCEPGDGCPMQKALARLRRVSGGERNTQRDCVRRSRTASRGARKDAKGGGR